MSNEDLTPYSDCQAIDIFIAIFAHLDQPTFIDLLKQKNKDGHTPLLKVIQSCPFNEKYFIALVNKILELNVKTSDYKAIFQLEIEAQEQANSCKLFKPSSILFKVLNNLKREDLLKVTSIFSEIPFFKNNNLFREYLDNLQKNHDLVPLTLSKIMQENTISFTHD